MRHHGSRLFPPAPIDRRSRARLLMMSVAPWLFWSPGFSARSSRPGNTAAAMLRRFASRMASQPMRHPVVSDNLTRRMTACDKLRAARATTNIFESQASHLGRAAISGRENGSFAHDCKASAAAAEPSDPKKKSARRQARRARLETNHPAIRTPPPSERDCANCVGRTGPGLRPPTPSPAETVLRSGTPAPDARQSGSVRDRR
jgi:hypothetical protein